MAANSISPVQSGNKVDSQRQSSRSVERRSERDAERSDKVGVLRAKRQERNDRDSAAVVELSKKSGTATPVAQTPQPVASSPAQDTAPTPKPAPTPVPPQKVEKSEETNIAAGAKIVHFAVEGGREKNKVFTFSSGDGPYTKPVKTEQKEPEKKAPEPTKVDAEA